MFTPLLLPILMMSIFLGPDYTEHIDFPYDGKALHIFVGDKEKIVTNKTKRTKIRYAKDYPHIYQTGIVKPCQGRKTLEVLEDIKNDPDNDAVYIIIPPNRINMAGQTKGRVNNEFNKEEDPNYKSPNDPAWTEHIEEMKRREDDLREVCKGFFDNNKFKEYIWK